jgi:hypothetical protein
LYIPTIIIIIITTTTTTTDTTTFVKTDYLSTDSVHGNFIGHIPVSPAPSAVEMEAICSPATLVALFNDAVDCENYKGAPRPKRWFAGMMTKFREKHLCVNLWGEKKNLLRET